MLEGYNRPLYANVEDPSQMISSYVPIFNGTGP